MFHKARIAHYDVNIGLSRLKDLQLTKYIRKLESTVEGDTHRKNLFSEFWKHVVDSITKQKEEAVEEAEFKLENAYIAYELATETDTDLRFYCQQQITLQNNLYKKIQEAQKVIETICGQNNIISDRQNYRIDLLKHDIDTANLVLIALKGRFKKALKLRTLLQDDLGTFKIRIAPHKENLTAIKFWKDVATLSNYIINSLTTQ